MKNVVIRIFLWMIYVHFAICFDAFAQEIKAADDLVEFADVKIKPEFRGETWAFYISHNLKYPEDALKNRISGKVYVSFIIEKNGDVTNVGVVQGLGYGLDEEALRVIKNSPRWRPGYRAKKDPVRVLCVMPISFTAPLPGSK